MAASKLLVYRMLASPAQVRAMSGVALLFLAVFVTAVVFQTPGSVSGLYFVPITSVLLTMAYWVTGTLLMTQARVLEARPLQFLAAGYFLSGFFLILRLLSFPGVLMPMVPTYNIPLWFYLTSHAMLPLGVMVYVWLAHAGEPPVPSLPPGRYLAGSVVLAGSLVLAATMAETSLAWTSPILLTACLVMLLLIVAMAMLGRTLHSVLDLWLLLVLWGWLLETALAALPSPGYTFAWYVGRCLGLLSGLFVLFGLLLETSKFYAQTVLQLEQRNQEREHRSLMRDTITASIAHELRQPLTAILFNAHVTRQALRPEGISMPLNEMGEVLDDIVAQSKRANDIIESTRLIFGRASAHKKSLVEAGALLQGALAMVAGDARAKDVQVELVVEGQPGSLVVNQLQVQQALLNLFQNAIEAMGHLGRPPRTLRVHCKPWIDPEYPQGRGVIIRVEDNGPGIPPAEREKIFDVFYTTRANGTGMGLAIARSVIEAHGGRLTVEPCRPTGTAFVIHLPYTDGTGAAD